MATIRARGRSSRAPTRAESPRLDPFFFRSAFQPLAAVTAREINHLQRRLTKIFHSRSPHDNSLSCKHLAAAVRRLLRPPDCPALTPPAEPHRAILNHDSPPTVQPLKLAGAQGQPQGAPDPGLPSLPTPPDANYRDVLPWAVRAREPASRLHSSGAPACSAFGCVLSGDGIAPVSVVPRRDFPGDRGPCAPGSPRRARSAGYPWPAHRHATRCASLRPGVQGGQAVAPGFRP